jgi:hypothetical protein
MSDVNHHDHPPDNDDDNNMVTPTNGEYRTLLFEYKS